MIVLTISEITLLIVYSTAYEMSFKMTICAHSAFVQSGFHVQRHCKTSRYLDVCILCTLIVHLYKYLSFLPYLHIYRLYYLYTICDCAISIYLIKRTHLKIALNKTVIKFYPQMNLLHISTWRHDIQTHFLNANENFSCTFLVSAPSQIHFSTDTYCHRYSDLG